MLYITTWICPDDHDQHVDVLCDQYGLVKLNFTFLRTATGHAAGCAGVCAQCGHAGPVLPRLYQQGAEFARSLLQLFAQADEQVEQPGDLQPPTS